MTQYGEVMSSETDSNSDKAWIRPVGKVVRKLRAKSHGEMGGVQREGNACNVINLSMARRLACMSTDTSQAAKHPLQT